MDIKALITAEAGKGETYDKAYAKALEQAYTKYKHCDYENLLYHQRFAQRSFSSMHKIISESVILTHLLNAKRSNEK